MWFHRGVELRGSVCLVTGASSGIGRATAAALVAAGAEVFASGLEDLDLAVQGAPARLAAAALAAHGRVDVLVNCAGAGQYGAVEDADAARLVALNVLAPIELTQALLPGMRERGRGHVVNVGSIVGLVGGKEEAGYASTKGGLVAFTDSLRQELSGTPVKVSLVTPGAIATAFFERRGRARASPAGTRASAAPARPG